MLIFVLFLITALVIAGQEGGITLLLFLNIVLLGRFLVSDYRK